MATTKKTPAKKTVAKKAPAKKAKAKAAPKKGIEKKTRSHKASDQCRKIAKHCDCTPNQVMVLQCLRDGKERTAKELSEATGIVKGKRLPDLYGKGYITTNDYEDSRAFMHGITSAGKKVLMAAEKSLKNGGK